ncbi:hypothetical protein RHOSPDRAFT_37065 [Rhodotorula sp. JG-1b]|nr:hypothetical protein RHOSPDRAFT_37065 [Rhodotorula sp. JG-1b]
MDYVDAAPLLDATLRDLEGTAHLVRDERYPMLELMSAIEINDPRTDTFLHARQQLPASGEFDPARQLEYSNSDLLDISNHLLQLEATFQAGHPLASTLWTCNLLRPSSLSTLASSASGTNTVLRALLLGTLKCSEIVHQELSKGQVYEHEDVHLSLPPTMSFSSLLASAYSRPPGLSRRRRHPPAPTPVSAPVPEQEQRSPLLVPGQDHHNTHQQQQVFDDSGRGLTDRPESDPAASDVVAEEPTGEEVEEEEEGEEQPRPEVTTDDVLRALDEALTALDADAKAEAGEGDEEEEVAEARRVRRKLRDMVMFRISFLYVLALMTSPHRASPGGILLHLAHLRSSLSALLPSASAPPPSSSATTTAPHPLPSSRLQAIFLPSRKVPLLSTQQPPRPVSPLSFRRAIEQTRQLCDDLEELVLLVQSWDQDDDKDPGPRWTRLEEWARGRGRKGATAVPYMRSLQQSVIVPSPTAPLFGSHPYLSLVQAFLASSLPLPSSFTSHLLSTLLHSLSFLRLRQSSSLTSPSPAHRVLSYFEQDLARDFLLRNTVHLSGQNRARQRRWTVKLLLLNNENNKEAGVGRGGGGIDEVLRPTWREVLPTLLEGGGDDDDDNDDHPGAHHHSPSSSKWLGPLTSHQRDLLIRFPDLLATALHRQSALWALEAHLSGFEASMQLFDSVEEKCQAWWAAERVALSIAREIEASLEREREREGAAADGEEAGRGNFALRDQLDEVHAIATLCRSSRKLASLDPGTVATAPKFSSPFLPELAIPPLDAARGRFRQHFEWLNVLWRRRDGPELVSFEAYEAARQTDDYPNELHEALAALARRIDPARTEAERTISRTMRDLCQVAQLHLEGWGSRRGSEQPNGHGTGTDSPLSGPLSWFALPTTSS